MGRNIRHITNRINTQKKREKKVNGLENFHLLLVIITFWWNQI